MEDATFHNVTSRAAHCRGIVDMDPGKGKYFIVAIKYEIIGEGAQILTNQKRESIVFSPLIGRNLRPFPDNFVLYGREKCIILYSYVFLFLNSFVS